MNSAGVYVAGEVNRDGNYSGVLVKFNSGGAQLWAVGYGGTGTNRDLAADSTGAVYLRGMKYSSTGSQLWSSQIGPAVEVDGTDNPIMAGSIDSAPAVVKYDPSGTQLWESTYASQDVQSGSMTALQLDSAGNSYAAGLATIGNTNPTRRAFIAMKVSSAGIRQWITQYDVGTQTFQGPVAMAVDATGVCIAGRLGTFDTRTDILTIKYNHSGALLWARRYDGPGGYDDNPVTVFSDALGNHYIGGTSYGAVSAEDFVTIKYNYAGYQRWALRYASNTFEDAEDTISGVVVDPAGHIYIAGHANYGFGV